MSTPNAMQEYWEPALRIARAFNAFVSSSDTGGSSSRGSDKHIAPEKDA